MVGTHWYPLIDLLPLLLFGPCCLSCSCVIGVYVKFYFQYRRPCARHSGMDSVTLFILLVERFKSFHSVARPKEGTHIHTHKQFSVVFLSEGRPTENTWSTPKWRRTKIWDRVPCQLMRGFVRLTSPMELCSFSFLEITLRLVESLNVCMTR